MASVVLRNGASSLRHFNRSLCYYTHHMWAPTLESFSIKRSHSLLHPFLPTSGIPLDYARKAYIFSIKYLSSSAAESEFSTLKKPEEAATKEEKTGESHQNGSAGKAVRSSSAAELSTPKKPEEAATKEEKTEESHQNDSAGKSVRGGPVSWLSLLLLMLTGVGLIYYYDKEKKRHIEGRLLGAKNSIN